MGSSGNLRYFRSKVSYEYFLMACSNTRCLPGRVRWMVEPTPCQGRKSIDLTSLSWGKVQCDILELSTANHALSELVPASDLIRYSKVPWPNVS